MPETKTVRQDIQNLVVLAQQRDPKGRTALYANIVALFEAEHHTLAKSERALMFDILSRLTHDVEMSIRIALAERLAEDETAPIDLILLLANDDSKVAQSVLLYSKLLSDAALIQIVHHKTIQHQLGIAARRNLSAPVSSRLVEVGNGNVIVALLANHTATIADQTFANIVTRSEHDAALHTPLVNRHDLPPILAARLYGWVSYELKRTLLESFPIDQTVIDAALAQTITSLQQADRAAAISGSVAARLVDKLYHAGQLTPAFVVKSLNQGQAELFDLAFARLLNLPVDIFRRVVHDRKADGLALACRAIGIDRIVFLTLYRLIQSARELSPDLSDSETARIFQLFETVDKRKAALILHGWAEDLSRTPLF